MTAETLAALVADLDAEREMATLFRSQRIQAEAELISERARAEKAEAALREAVGVMQDLVNGPCRAVIKKVWLHKRQEAARAFLAKHGDAA